MSFTFIQNGPTFSTFGAGTVSLNPALSTKSTPGTLLVAFIESATGGTPFKCAGNLVAPANDLGASALGSGGTFAAGTYFWKITFTTAAGETQASNEASVAVVLNGRATLTWTQAPTGINVTGVKVYRGTTTGNEDHLITTLAANATSYTDTGTTGSVASPPTNNTATTTGVNPQPGWEWIGMATPGSNHQQEVWAYRMNPGNIGGVAFTNANGSTGRSTVMEFSSTLRYQFVEPFPGFAQANSAVTSFPVSMQNQVGANELAIATFGTKFSVNPTGQSWTTPSGWNLVISQANSLGQPWAVYYKTTTGVGAPSVTGLYSTSTNMTAWDALICVFQETDAVRGRMGGSGINANTYNDESTLGFPNTAKGARAEFDHFISTVTSPTKTRVFAQGAMCQYQTTEGGSITSIPGEISDSGDLGAQFLWSAKPTRALSGASLTAEQTKYDNNIAFIKQKQYFCWQAAIHNEYNLGGANGPFGNDTNKPSGDPYGTGNTAATAQANWLAHWAHYQPLFAAHGIPCGTVPSLSSAPSVSQWHPPAGTVSFCMVHAYADTGVNQNHFIDVSPQSGVPSIQDICDGIRNPDNSVPSPANAQIPLGSGEVGRSGSGALTTPWANVAQWSHKSGSNPPSYAGHWRDVFAARLVSRTFATASVVNNSTTLADSGNSFTSADIGRPVRTANVPWNTVIQSITDSGHAVMSSQATATSGPQTCTLTGKQNTMILWFSNNINSGNWIHTPGAVVNGVAEDQTSIQKELAAWVDNLSPLAPAGPATLSITTSSPLPSGQVGTPY